MKDFEWEDDAYKVPVPPDVNEYHILIVDEDQIYSRNVASILREASYQVTEIPIPEVALAKIQEQPMLFDLVLLGTPLKTLDCISFPEEILAVNEYMAVIFMCSKPDFHLAVTALQSGATLVLDKPIKKHNFLSLWQHVLRKRSLKDKKKERENTLMGMNLRSASLNDSESSSVHDARGKWKEVKMEEVVQSPMAGKKEKPRKVKAPIEKCKTKIETRKRKERGQVRGDQKKSRVVWNSELYKKFMDKLTNDDAHNAGNGAGATSQPTINQNLRRHTVASIVQRNRLKALYALAAISENSVARSAPNGSGLQSKTASAKSPEAGATGATKTPNGAGFAGMDLQARIRQIRSAYEARKQHSDQEVNSIYRAPNLAVTVTKPCELTGSDCGAVLLGMQLSSNMTRSPRVNVSGRTPAASVSLTAGENPRPNETQGLSHAVNSENRNVISESEDQESSSSDESVDDGFALDELVPELKNGSDDEENTSTSEDHEE